ncbi:MAG: DUF1700 domain-containing protein [Clostridium sp.]|uniref:DUF1700 domain-containing protein n=1 Tax=Clostridium sp. TaxID=1506 RepID=UPI00305482E9
MSKEKFINDLKNKLKRLPKEEVDNIVGYYLDYFQDADKDEAEVLMELGSPSTIASQILSDYAFSPSTKENNKGNLNKVMLIILSIFAAPIALPLAFAFIMVLFSMLIVIGTLLFTFVAVAASLFFAGILVCFTGFAVLFQAPATGAMYMGLGLIVIGLGLLLIVGLKILSPKIYVFISNTTKNCLSKFNKSKPRVRGDL